MRKLIGNDKAYETFAAWIGGGRLPHGILLEGPRGAGKASFAAQLAQAALCEASGPDREGLPGGGDKPPCGVCRHCVKMEKGVHPDFLTFEGEGRSRSFHIDTVRDIRSRAFVYPNEAERKVFLLKNVQDMSVQAQNALLKILEEPPESVLFLLTCENRSLLLETILSRVVTLSLAVPSVARCKELLAELRPDLEPAALEDAAAAAGGNVGRALELAEDSSAGRGGEAAALWESLAAGREAEALAALAKYDRDRKAFQDLLAALRALVEAKVLRRPDSSNISSLRLMKIIAIIDETAAACAGNGNVSLLGSVLCARTAALK